MSNKKESPRIRVFVPPSFEGVASVAVLEEVIHDDIDVEVRYTRHLDFRDYNQFSDVEIVIILGLAFNGYILSDDFYINVDVPFGDFLHFSTFGESIEGKHIVSTVSEEMDPIKTLYQFLHQSPESSILAKHTTFTEKSFHIVEAVNAYRTWTWENNDTTRVLLALYNAGYKHMPRLIRNLSLPETVKKYAPLIKGQLEKMNDYIQRKTDIVKTTTVDIAGVSCLLKVVFAEEYINELANHLLTQENSSMPIIVCVGRTTKGNDIFSIRTRNIHAGKIAYRINDGNGKESVASVFSEIGYSEFMRNVITSALNQSNG